MDAAIKLRSFEAGYKAIVTQLLHHAKLLSSEEYGEGSAWISRLVELHAEYERDSSQTVAQTKVNRNEWDFFRALLVNTTPSPSFKTPRNVWRQF